MEFPSVIEVTVSRGKEKKVQILMVGDGGEDHYLDAIKTAMVADGHDVERVTRIGPGSNPDPDCPGTPRS